MSKRYDLRKRNGDAISGGTPKKRVINDDDSEDKDWTAPRVKVLESDEEDSEVSDVLEGEDSGEDDDSDDASDSYDCDEDDEDGEEDDSEEYYEYDKSSLTDAITEQLSRKLAQLNIPKESLKTAVEQCMEKAQSDIFDGYCANKPADTRWKAGLSEDVVNELEPTLKSIREEMDKERPDMVKILKTHIPTSEKKKAVKLFDILQNAEPFTEEYFDIETRIQDILDTEKEYEGVNIEEMEAEEKRLKSSITSSIYTLKIRILSLDADDSTKTEIMNMFNKMNNMNPMDSEYSNIRNKIEMAVSLPHRRMTKPELPTNATNEQIDDYCVTIRKRLDSHLYGMGKVKERLIEIVNNRLKNPSARGSIALTGGPGVGKTAIAQALAQSLGMPFDRISLGGLQDATILKGQDNAWVGASPSIILQILRKMKYCNGILLFDEIDKLGDKGKEIQYALLHITDYVQNNQFQDMFLREFPHDLSKIWFMYAMNDDTWLDPILRDRLSIMRVEQYSTAEKMVIVEKYMLPSAITNIGRNPGDITISQDGCSAILASMASNQDGLRSIQKGLERLCSRINMLLTSGDDNRLNLSYFIKGVKLPLVIDSQLVKKLWPVDAPKDEAPARMYL